MQLGIKLLTAVLLSLMAVGMSSSQQEPNDSKPQVPAETRSSPDNAPKPQAPAENPQASPDNSPVEQPPATQNEKQGSSAGDKATSSKSKRRSNHKHSGSYAAAEGPRRIVIRRGSTSEPTAQLAPGMTQEQANKQRQDTDQLLASTEGDLQQLATRTLNPEQRETLGQIRNYMSGARAALNDNDLQRAHTLASKAHLLSDDLVKH